MSALLQDLRYAGRTLRKSPGFALLVTLILGLGTGVTTSVFSVVDGVLLRPLAFADADRIVAVNTHWKNTGRNSPRMTGPDYVDVRAQAHSFAAMSTYRGGEVGVQLPDRADFAGTWWVNAGYFETLGLRPVRGRLFRDGEPTPVAVVSLPFAVRNFGGAGDALGRTLSVEGVAYEVAGVLAAGQAYPAKAAVWLPGPYQPESMERTAFNYRAIAKLKPGVSEAQATAELETIGARLEAAYPGPNRNKSFAAISLRDQMVAPLRSTLLLLLGAVGVVLLIACFNVANLLLSRSERRARELAVRSALGAARLRLARQLMLENVLLAGTGAVLGVAITFAALRFFARVAPESLPRVQEVGLNGEVLLFAVGVSLGSTLLFGLVPAWQLSRANLNTALRAGGGRGTVGGARWLRQGLVLAEVALSVLLAVGAGLFFRSFVALNTAELGYRTEGVLVMQAHAPAHTEDEYTNTVRFLEALGPQLAAIPGVQSAASVMGLPGGPYGSNGGYVTGGADFRQPGLAMPQADFSLTSPGYFATMGVPLLKGRDFRGNEDLNQPLVAIVSEALVKQSFPNEDPIGKRIVCGLDNLNPMTIVGVVGNVRQDSPAARPGATLYMPLQQHPYHANELNFVLRAGVEPASLIPAVEKKAHALNPRMATRFTTMPAILSSTVATPRFRTSLVTGFAAFALALAMAGIYGVISFLTAQRTAELGVRMALGATPGQIAGMVLRQAGLLTGSGLTLGVGASLLLGGLMDSMLFGLRHTDVATYAAVAAAIGAASMLAAWFPAWRAMRIDPMAALREE